ncbi:MAG: protein phosphatase 2C domain-containing protein [Chromatiales bacterium]
METRTDRGHVRKVNEDRVAADAPAGLLVVADGMGGHRGGDVASELATQTIVESLTASDGVGSGEERLRAAIGDAQRVVIDGGQRLPHLFGMATTVVVALLRDGRLDLAHVGDSRAYRFSTGGLERLTRDHSLVEELVASGMFASVEEAEDAGVPPSVLVRGLGLEAEAAEPDCREVDLAVGDIVLLCTDGLTSMVDDRMLAGVLGDPDLSLAEQADRLVALALDNGGMDNVTLALARVEPPGS